MHVSLLLWHIFLLFLLIFSSINTKCDLTDALDSKFSDESDDLADEGITGPERAYRGPHLLFPLQKKDIDTLIELFRKKKVRTEPNKMYSTNDHELPLTNCQE